MIVGMKPKESFVFAVRQAVGETQEVFADRLGVSARSVKRYELENTLPASKAVLRILESLAKKHNVSQDQSDFKAN
ncbi:MAG: helix-turn-helix domain-containing protein [Armatimonadetes bacterium]|nr:helix-turn-helix domain-containing protein [Armatimonadota bacterium]